MKKLLALILAAFCVFFVGCEDKKDETPIEIIKFESLTTNQSSSSYYLTIQFRCSYAINDLVINVPIYTYQKATDGSRYNILEREIAEINVGTTVKNGTYRMSYVLKHQTAWGSFDSIGILIGTITIKSGEIIE